MERCDRGCLPHRRATFHRIVAATCWRLSVLPIVLATTGPASSSAFFPAPPFRFRSHNQGINIVPSQEFLFSKSSSPSCRSRLAVLDSGEEVDRVASVVETMAIKAAAGTGLRSQEETLPSALFNQTFLVHKGRSADMILRSPAISGLTVCRNWSEAASEALVAATKELVARNPILSGCVCQVQKDWCSPRELWIEGGQYLPDSSHSFVQRIPAPSHVTAEQLAVLNNATKLVSYVQEHISPSLASLCVSTSVQIERRLPVLQVSLMTVPSTSTTTDPTSTSNPASPSWAIYAMTVSHAVGDGVTFFQLLKQLSLHMSWRALHSSSSSSSSSTNGYVWPAIDWHVSTRGTHELYPPSFSWRDVEISYGLPFFVGLVKNAIATLSRRRPTILLLDKDALRTQKLILRQTLGNSTLSSNDVITLALCQANPSMDVFVFTENARNNMTIPYNAGGNFLWEVPISRTAVLEHPLALREAIVRLAHYSTNSVTTKPYWCGKVGRITSLATITEQVLFPGVETIGTLPLTTFLNDIPMDIALIFRLDKRHLGVLHNFADLRLSDSPLLRAMLVKD